MVRVPRRQFALQPSQPEFEQHRDGADHQNAGNHDNGDKEA
ncbi:hypothetical protein BX592_10417 [Paraburkholderia rhizosphaerae]|uniref:Uncharacterized protein n=1 Tax=Paraburkholderia rhizosphaerae TaxID=480658 RepID=A0A4R8LXT0_9BURK|nr:hypothetical protein BX592_10417 [Paraburkholderia rhizosphaerae]